MEERPLTHSFCRPDKPNVVVTRAAIEMSDSDLAGLIRRAEHPFAVQGYVDLMDMARQFPAGKLLAYFDLAREQRRRRREQKREQKGRGS